MLIFPNKKLRAEVIFDYVKNSEYKGCVCFSCGNASKALKDVGLFVVDISQKGSLVANRWWSPEEIHLVWPNLFDATSGHLPAFLMVRIGKRFREYLGNLEGNYNVPSGSGETIQCLRWEYPHCNFTALFNCGEGTERHEEAPLVKIAEQYK